MKDKIDIFSTIDYKQFLRKKLKIESAVAKGLRSNLAAFIGCQPSYLSQVLNGKPQLTLEQAKKLCQFFAFNKLETKYFILMTEYARAGSVDLANFFQEQILEIQKNRFHIKERLATTEDIASEDRHKYYSAWYYSAVHVALSIQGLQSSQKIAARFHLPVELVLEAIEFLEKIDLIRKIDGKYEFTKRNLHLERESIFIQRHHINWRSQALQSAEKNLKEDVHYSNVIAIAKEDYEKIKEVFVAAIEKTQNIIKPSREEEIYAITLDIFRL